MTQDSVSDELLLEGFCAGNEDWAGRFGLHFWRPLCWVAFGIVGDSGSAEDVAQTVLSTLEGAMLVARPYGDLARFNTTTDRLLASLTS